MNIIKTQYFLIFKMRIVRMKNIIPLVFLILMFNQISAQITVDDSSFTVQQLVEDILIDSPCAQVSNFSSFTGTAQGFNGIGYFEANGSGFEIDRGVILSTGNARSAEGPNGATQLSEGDSSGWPGDADLATITATPNLNNATFIQFDFVPTVDFISFDFLFASEEYVGTFPCSFSDVFAFILTDSSGNSVNLAVVPGTNPPIPIKVTTVNEGVPGTCPPQNEVFFNRSVPPGTNAPIDFNGYTEILTASGAVTAGETYTIKLVIAEETDGAYDSAVFLEAGSFNLGGNIGVDQTISAGNPGCLGTPIILDATIGTAAGTTYVWMKDGQPLAPGDGTTVLAGGAQLEVSQNGTYSVEINVSTSCTASDSVIIEFTTPPTIAQQPEDIVNCDADRNGLDIFDLTPNATRILGTQDPSIFVISYHLTEADAIGFTGTDTANTITTPNAYQNITQTQTIWIRIADLTHSCSEIVSFDIEVVNDPIANTATPIESCDDAVDGDDTNGMLEFDLTAKQAEVLGTQNAAEYEVLFYIDQATADAGLAGTELPLLYTNTSATQTIVARIQSITSPQCYETTTFDLIVNALPTVNSTVRLLQCDNDVDGFSLFNLTEANTLISANAANETFTYYLTQAQAQAGNVADQLTNFLAYPNPIALNSIVFARIENTDGCIRTAQIDLEVSTTQIPATFNLNFTLCDDALIDNDNANGIVTFDISSATNDIIALFPGGQALTVTYYQNEADALAEQNAILDPSNYRNDSSPFTQNLYVRVDSNVNNACLGLGEHITLQVDPLPANNTVSTYNLCSDDPNLAVFDLTTKDSEVIGTQTEDLLISYHRTEQDAINNTAAITGMFTNESNPQQIWVRVQFDENGNGTSDAGECARTDISFELQVLHNPVLTTPDPIIICSDQVDTVYDLTIREAQIASGTTVTLSYMYYESQTDLDNNNPIATPANYLSTTLTNTILIQASDTNNGCSSTISLDLRTILYENFELLPAAIEECEIDNDGFDEFNLRRILDEVLNVDDADPTNDLNRNDFNISFYEVEADAIAGNTNFIATPTMYTNIQAFNHTVYLRLDPIAPGNDCFRVIPVPLIVNQSPVIAIEDEYTLCLDANDMRINLLPTATIDTQLSPTEYTFQWYTGVVPLNTNEIAGATNSTFLPDVAGDYTVQATNIATGCTIPATTTVIGSYPPESITAELTTEAFSSNAMIEVTVVGRGEYEYRLDAGGWQSSNIFTNVFRGEHTVVVRDLRLCGELEFEVEVIVNYPRFFTPNGDGWNDIWTITGSDQVTITNMLIFDRHGKLLKVLGASGGSWDGMYNGQKMPSSDYWFKVLYIEEGVRKEFRANFTLKR